MAPGHDRDGRDRVLRRALDDLVADREVDERVPLLIDNAIDVGVLEKHRGTGGVDRLLAGQAGDIDRDRPDLAARDREARRVLGQAERAFDAAGARLADVAGDAGHLGVVERADTDPVILAEKPECRADAGQIVRPRRAGRHYERDRKTHGTG